MLVGEIAGGALEHLETSLSSMFVPHIAERADWGKVDEESKRGLADELKRTSAGLVETRRVLRDGLKLARPREGMDLEELVRLVLGRLKNKKPPMEADVAKGLEG